MKKALPAAAKLLPAFFIASGLVAGSLDALKEDTPFLPRDQSAAAAAAGAGSDIEFRGMMSTKDGTLFGLYDKNSKEAFWLREGASAGNFSISTFDAENESLTIEANGKKINVALASAVIAVARPTATQPGARQGGRGAGQMQTAQGAQGGGGAQGGQVFVGGQRGAAGGGTNQQAVSDNPRTQRVQIDAANVRARRAMMINPNSGEQQRQSGGGSNNQRSRGQSQ